MRSAVCRQSRATCAEWPRSSPRLASSIDSSTFKLSSRSLCAILTPSTGGGGGTLRGVVGVCGGGDLDAIGGGGDGGRSGVGSNARVVGGGDGGAAGFSKSTMLRA